MDAALPATVDAAPVMDEDAFRAFYGRTARPLWAYLYRATRDGALADDLLQETYYRLLRARTVFESEEHRVHYLFRIAANLLADTHRRRPPDHVPLTERGRPRGRRAGLCARGGAADRRGPRARPRSPRAIATCCGSPTPTARATRRSPAHLGIAQPSVKAMLFRARQRLAARLRRVNAAWQGRGR